MTDTTPKFDPIPRLQEIAATIREVGGIADIFTSPATSAYDIECAIKEIERLRKERDEARRMWCEAAPVGNCLSVDDMNQRARAEAKRRGWDCFKENS